MMYQLSDINGAVKTDPAAFLAACDEAYRRKVSEAAEGILNHISDSPVVLLSGPSGSGKTTTAMKISEELARRGVKSRTVSMDNYFLPFDPKISPMTPEGAPDFESPLCLDWDLLDQHFTRLAAGEEIIVPKFEFARQMRNDSRGMPMRLEPNEIAIFEGIHALNDRITALHPEAFRLYISARSDVKDGDALRFKGTWVRLARRAVRDYSFRGTGVGVTLDRWANVRRGEKLYISPFKDKAHLKFDSELPYEICVMKNYAKPLFDAVPAENQRRSELLELVEAFQFFEPIDPALVPADSLLREFIGGGSYKYH